MLKKLNGVLFFPFPTKIFHNTSFSSLCVQINNNKRYCLHLAPKVSNKTKF